MSDRSGSDGDRMVFTLQGRSDLLGIEGLDDVVLLEVVRGHLNGRGRRSDAASVCAPPLA